MVNLKLESQIHQGFMKCLYQNKIKVDFCKLHTIPNKFEICIRKKHELKDKELDELSFLLKMRINLCNKQICFKTFKQKV